MAQEKEASSHSFLFSQGFDKIAHHFLYQGQLLVLTCSFLFSFSFLVLSPAHTHPQRQTYAH